jgi:hypothetical protein
MAEPATRRLSGARPDSLVYTLEEFERAVAQLDLPDAA